MKHPILANTFRNTILAAMYVFIVTQIMQNAEKWMGEGNQIIGPFVFLMLFCLSAAVVGGLVLGEGIWLFINNKKSDSIKAIIYSIGWLGVYTVIGLLFLILAR
jgi:hypothetical protein